MKYQATISGYCFLVVILFIFSWSSGFAQRTIPELWGHRVHDEAHALSTPMLDQLEKHLASYEDSTSNQIAVLIINSLHGEVIETYSLRVSEQWQLGQKEKDNGVLLLIAIDDSRMRIEVGQGLEGVLTDAHCSRIIRNEIAPEFRRQNFDAGVWAGVKAIEKAIGGEYAADDVDGMSDEDWYLLWGAVAFFVSILIYSFYREFKTSNTPRVGPPSTSSSSSSSSDSDSSWSSSSSSSGSSFSGGGGSFGGGGASGSW